MPRLIITATPNVEKKKLHAIKAIRALTGYELKDAKDSIERSMRDGYEEVYVSSNHEDIWKFQKEMSTYGYRVTTSDITIENTNAESPRDKLMVMILEAAKEEDFVLARGLMTAYKKRWL
ncbi:MAG: ribosomal protein L7/L12 [Candidatus Marinimicrobia bacterium]|nr:ribosomal protein L7/L12 [Candidatus Neomarinimicrobiota bacterium]